MSNLLIDTSVIIAHLRTHLKNDTLLTRIAQNHESLFISTITEFEILRGTKIEQEKNTKEILSLFEILNFDSISANIASEIYKDLKKNNKPIDFPDLIIAATAIQFKLKVVTLNSRHFENIPNLELLVE